MPILRAYHKIIQVTARKELCFVGHPVILSITNVKVFLILQFAMFAVVINYSSNVRCFRPCQNYSTSKMTTWESWGEIWNWNSQVNKPRKTCCLETFHLASFMPDEYQFVEMKYFMRMYWLLITFLAWKNWIKCSPSHCFIKAANCYLYYCFVLLQFRYTFNITYVIIQIL